jgi:hypothetical protein
LALSPADAPRTPPDASWGWLLSGVAWSVARLPAGFVVPARRSQLDRLYQRDVDDLDTLVRRRRPQSRMAKAPNENNIRITRTITVSRSPALLPPLVGLVRQRSATLDCPAPQKHLRGRKVGDYSCGAQRSRRKPISLCMSCSNAHLGCALASCCSAAAIDPASSFFLLPIEPALPR